MFVIRREQINAIVLGNRRLLVRDIEEHLARFRPQLSAAYPRPYLRWVIDDSLTLALGLGIDDVRMLRVFVRLRWDIAPGFYKQPRIAAVLADRSLDPLQRFETLAGEAYESAWSDAERYDDAAEWRTRFWAKES